MTVNCHCLVNLKIVVVFVVSCRDCERASSEPLVRQHKATCRKPSVKIMEPMDYIVFEDALDILEILDQGFPRRIYDRANDFENLDNWRFYRRYRLTKETVLQVLELIEEHLEFPSDMNNSVSPINQLLMCLRFFASAGHLKTISDIQGMHISTVSRIVKRVTMALAPLCNRFIQMPDTPAMVAATQQKFFDIAQFPRVIGLIDGTHVKIQSPGGNDAEVFRNRKTYFSINVQCVCDADLNIQDIVARWPGSAHDATIFNNSRIRARFEHNEFSNSLLLGDGGYPVRSYFFTPLLNPQTVAQQRYQTCHIRTRNAVERLFGVWKRRFPVLAYGLRLKLETTLPVIVACAVLHNIANKANVQPPPPPENIDPHDLEIAIANGQIPHVPLVEYNQNILINDVRSNFINQYFAHL